jgi:PAS domain S-box-containing protein
MRLRRTRQTPAAGSLRLLLVAMQAEVGRLIQRELARDGYGVTSRRVTTASTLRQALRHQAWDLIIADHDSPGFSASAALELLRELGTDIPLIVVSPAVSEETAADLMRAGARDVVSMDKLRRLLPALRRELGEAEVRRQRRRIEAELGASRQQLEVILGGIADGVLVQDAGGQFVYANLAAAQMAGFSGPGEYLSAGAAEISARLEVVDAEGQPFDYELLPARRALRGEEAPQMVVQFRRRDSGEARWSLTRARAVTGADGQLLAISLFHDLTERIQAERRLTFLAAAGARMGTSLDEGETLTAITDLAVQTLADWAAVYLVESGEPTLRPATVAHRDETGLRIAQELQTRYPPRPGPQSPFWPVLQEGRPTLVRHVQDAHLARVAQDAEHLRLLREMHVASGLYVPLTARGQTLGVLALFTTSTSGRQLGPEDVAVAEEIGRRAALAVDNARLYTRAREAIKTQEAFLGIASHELRTPVTTISAAAQLLLRARRRGTLEGDQLDRSLGLIEQTAGHLARLTDDLLNVARLQEGRLPLRLREIDLAELVRSSEHAGGVGDRPLRLELLCDPCWLTADPDRIQQVLSNLLDNAAKYSPDGAPIEISLAEEGDGVLLTVRDQGIGLPQGTGDRIFEPFGRARNAADRHIRGLGLGLFICRQIAERHGGRLWAESPGEGQGTAMRLWLPRRPDGSATPREDA